MSFGIVWNIRVIQKALQSHGSVTQKLDVVIIREVRKKNSDFYMNCSKGIKQRLCDSQQCQKPYFICATEFTSYQHVNRKSRRFQDLADFHSRTTVCRPYFFPYYHQILQVTGSSIVKSQFITLATLATRTRTTVKIHSKPCSLLKWCLLSIGSSILLSNVSLLNIDLSNVQSRKLLPRFIYSISYHICILLSICFQKYIMRLVLKFNSFITLPFR